MISFRAMNQDEEGMLLNQGKISAGEVVMVYIIAQKESYLFNIGSSPFFSLF